MYNGVLQFLALAIYCHSPNLQRSERPATIPCRYCPKCGSTKQPKQALSPLLIGWVTTLTACPRTNAGYASCAGASRRRGAGASGGYRAGCGSVGTRLANFPRRCSSRPDPRERSSSGPLNRCPGGSGNSAPGSRVARIGGRPAAGYAGAAPAIQGCAGCRPGRGVACRACRLSVIPSLYRISKPTGHQSLNRRSVFPARTRTTV